MKVCFLATRIPARHRRGDQLRAYHHLRLLAPRHEITCVVLGPAPPVADREALEALGVRVAVVRFGWAGAVPALAGGLWRDDRPFQLLLYARQRAATELADLLRQERFDVVHAQLIRTGAYLPTGGNPPLVIDLVDALSESTRRRAALTRGLGAAVLGIEAARLEAAERRLIERGVPCLVVSRAERDALGGGPAVQVVPNGVDLGAFAYHEGPRPAGRLVFTGSLGYFPNVDAACWFVHDVLPVIRRSDPGAELRLVGARPSRRVRGLARVAGVSVAPDVPDMAPELAGASVAVVPLRAGAGLQNKVLEAMGVGTPVVATPRATAGLELQSGEHLLVAEGPDAFAAAVTTLLRDPTRARRLARAARGYVERAYRWETSAAAVDAVWRSRVA